MNFLKVVHETEEEFRGIAYELFNNYAIQNHDSIYRITDIEFYWTSPIHKDESTYKRIHVNPNQGEWFFHYSGVDIALKNKNGGHGGILIRGIFDINEKKKYKGPLVCMMKLFSGTSAFEKSIETKIVKHEFKKEEFKNSIRIGLGENAKKSGTDQLNYRYYIEINDTRSGNQ